MKRTDFDFYLPAELIAQRPVSDRAAARLMVLDRRAGTIEHRRFIDLPGLLGPANALVLNNTRVFKARLFGYKPSGGRVEILLIRSGPDGTWEALVDKQRRIPADGRIMIDQETHAWIVRRDQTRVWLRFNRPAEEVIDRHGVMPLPHYIRRPADAADEESYQTVYARRPGSIAAPTAGLHFTPEILSALRQGRTAIVEITLHVGPGTFRPIRTEEIEQHRMEPEYFEVSADAAAAINDRRRIISVGTTTTRVLEYLAGKSTVQDQNGRWPINAGQGWADIFMYPGFQFRIVQGLITNFHLPRSTPLLLVCAFAGRDLIFHAYEEAIRRQYRFYSYGDAMIII